MGLKAAAAAVIILPSTSSPTSVGFDAEKGFFFHPAGFFFRGGGWLYKGNDRDFPAEKYFGAKDFLIFHSHSVEQCDTKRRHKLFALFSSRKAGKQREARETCEEALLGYSRYTIPLSLWLLLRSAGCALDSTSSLPRSTTSRKHRWALSIGHALFRQAASP